MVLLSSVDLMSAPEQWVGRQVTLIALITGDRDPRILGTAAGGDNQQLWLAEPLPQATTAKLSKDTAVLKLRGKLSPPGGYGPDAKFPYQFAAESAVVVEVGRPSLQALAANPRAFDRTALALDGTLIATGGSAILADDVSPGGVPAANAHQIKLRQVDSAALTGLRRQGEVRFGAVSILGWWQDGTLDPFSIRQK